MALSDELEALAKRHGALSYRNRADTQNPAFGFSVAGLESLLAEVRKRDEALIEQMQDALEEILDLIDLLSPLEGDTTRKVRKAITAARARLGEKTSQAGAVPLTDEQLAEMMRETWGCASIAPRHAMKFARAIEAAHGIGIKGGQHGAE